MFKNIFIDLCNKKGEAPSCVCRKVGITPATFSGWTEKTIPRQATLHRIADYFGVTVDYLLSDEKKSPLQEIPEGLDELDAEIIKIYNQLSDSEKRQAISYLQFLHHKSQGDE